MYKESETMRQIHQIQEKIYEETRHMTVEEKIEYINKTAEEVEEKYSLNLKKVLPVR
ncbi:MAG: hypothetical protein ACE5HR_05945 [bacterium]